MPSKPTPAIPATPAATAAPVAPAVSTPAPLPESVDLSRTDSMKNFFIGTMLVITGLALGYIAWGNKPPVSQTQVPPVPPVAAPAPAPAPAASAPVAAAPAASAPSIVSVPAGVSQVVTVNVGPGSTVTEGTKTHRTVTPKDTQGQGTGSRGTGGRNNPVPPSGVPVGCNLVANEDGATLIQGMKKLAPGTEIARIYNEEIEASTDKLLVDLRKQIPGWLSSKADHKQLCIGWKQATVNKLVLAPGNLK